MITEVGVLEAVTGAGRMEVEGCWALSVEM